LKEPFYNETRQMLPHIRNNFLYGRQIYRDQTKPIRYEDAKVQEIVSGQIRQYGGVRLGFALHGIIKPISDAMRAVRSKKRGG
jgi:hypothetical protein